MSIEAGKKRLRFDQRHRRNIGHSSKVDTDSVVLSIRNWKAVKRDSFNAVWGVRVERGTAAAAYRNNINNVSSLIDG